MTTTTQDRSIAAKGQDLTWPPPAYGTFAFHLAGDTEQTHLARSSSAAPTTISTTATPTSSSPPFSQDHELTTMTNLSMRSFHDPLPIPVTPTLATASAPIQPSTSSSSSLSQSEQMLIEVDQDLTKVSTLLSGLARSLSHPGTAATTSIITPAASFEEHNCFELYHPDPQICLAGLAKERQRLLESRQALRIQWIGIQAQAEQLRETATATKSLSQPPERTRIQSNSNHNNEIETGALSSASVAVALALHEASARRLEELAKVDGVLNEIQRLIQRIYFESGGRSGLVPREYFASPTISHLFKIDRTSALKTLAEEVLRLQHQRLELLKTHQKLHVQGLIAQMQALSGVGVTLGGPGGSSS